MMIHMSSLNPASCLQTWDRCASKLMVSRTGYIQAMDLNCDLLVVVQGDIPRSSQEIGTVGINCWLDMDVRSSSRNAVDPQTRSFCSRAP